MDVVFNILWNIEVKYCLNIVHIKTSCGNVCRNQNLGGSVTEAIHNLVTHHLAQIAVQCVCKIASSL